MLSTFWMFAESYSWKRYDKKNKRENPRSNIVPIDYDPGATKVNQENRIKLMLAIAREQSMPDDVFLENA